MEPLKRDVEKAEQAGFPEETKMVCANGEVDCSPEKDQENEEEKEEEAPVDPWDLTDFKVETVKWSELTTGGKVKRVLRIFFTIVGIIAMVYFFICSIDIMSSAFQLIAGKAAGGLFKNSKLLANPVAGLMIGILVTVLVQSSSTSTSIIVTMVGSGALLIDQAIPIIMGANVGTTVTNTIVALPQASNRNEFRRAFAGATVHDMFNWLTILVLLPIEAASHMLLHLTTAIMDSTDLKTNENANQQFLNVITKPFTKLIVQVDKKVITDIADGDEEAMKKPILKTWCVVNEYNSTCLNETTGLNETCVLTDNIERCKSLFSQFEIADQAAGFILLAVSIVSLCLCLITLVKLLNSILKGQVAVLIRKALNAKFPGYAEFLTGYFVMMIGTGVTILVQSSSIFTSSMTPLVGIGLVKLETMYPLTLGSNIGTTITSVLAALVYTGDQLYNALQASFVHLFFNIFGICIWYTLPPMRRIPLGLAKGLGNTTAQYRWFSIAYLIGMFLLMPLFFFGLSLAGWQVAVGVGVPVLVLLITIVVINILQRKAPRCLPKVLRTWDFLPEPLHSLAPYDRVISKCNCCKCCRKKDEHSEEDLQEDDIEKVEAIAVPSSSSEVAVAQNGTVNKAFDDELTTYM